MNLFGSTHGVASMGLVFKGEILGCKLSFDGYGYDSILLQSFYALMPFLCVSHELRVCSLVLFKLLRRIHSKPGP